MSHQDDKKLNQDHELDRLRDLIGDAQDGPFSLDDIMAEYSTKKKPGSVVHLSQEPEPEAPGKVIRFPGAARQEPEETPDPQADIPPVPAEESTVLKEHMGDKVVVAFPEKENPITALLRSLSQKADRYAEHMFEDEDMPTSPETRRMEELIPGVDQESDPAPRRRHRRKDPPEPDRPPKKLAQYYDKTLKGVTARMVLVFLLLLPAVYLMVEHTLPLPPIPNPLDPAQPLLTQPIKVWVSGGLLFLSMALSMDILFHAALRLLRGRLGMDTLLLFACVFTLTDTLTAQALLPRQQLPYCGLNILALLLALLGKNYRSSGLRHACRTAAASAAPYLVTLDEDKWNGQDAYTKHVGTAEGFGSQIQADDGAQLIFRRVCPPLLIACVALSVLSSVGTGRPERIFWCLSATFTAACSLSAPLIFGRPFFKLALRLGKSGALAGWPGVADSHRNNGILLTDRDLFPPGSVALNGSKFYGDWSPERVIGYTATLIHASGSGLDKVFHDLLRSQGAIYRKIDRFLHEEGGLSTTIRGEEVLVGSASYMQLYDVELPQGLKAKNAVFCAIDGKLAGIFALNYTLPDAVFPCVSALLQEKINPVLATRDFNLIPDTLRQRFKLAADRMIFPNVERRRELSDAEQPHNTTITAVLNREGIQPYVETVVGARRLRLAVRLNAILCCVGSVLGVLLAAYLTGAGAFASISPLSLLVYLLLWLIPSWLITGWVEEF